MKLKCQKYSENSKEMTFFSDVLCFISTMSRSYIYNVYFCSSPLLNACLAKAKKQLLNKYTKVGKRCFNLNHRPQSAFDDRTEW